MTKPDWTRKLSEPFDLGGRRKLRTLADVREHLMKLPEERQQWRAWQHAAKVLLEAAESGDVRDVEITLRLGRYALMAEK
jgi:hypothetical protein